VSDPLRITWWEYEELLEHLEQRPDIWMQSEENPLLWMRLVKSPRLDVEEEVGNALALHFMPPTQEGPYRQYGIQVFPQEWPEAECTSYLDDLLSKWTAFGHRKRTVATLRDCQVEHAELIAIAVEAIDWLEAPAPDPETASKHSDALQQRMYPPAPDPIDITTELFYGNRGWMNLRRAGGMIRVRASVKSRDGLWGQQLEGFVRPRDGRIEDTVSFLLGLGSSASADARQDIDDARAELLRLQMELRDADQSADVSQTADSPEPELVQDVPELPPDVRLGQD
jgi:hypothetical protein